jgi:hypothetical protein
MKDKTTDLRFNFRGNGELCEGFLEILEEFAFDKSISFSSRYHTNNRLREKLKDILEDIWHTSFFLTRLRISPYDGTLHWSTSWCKYEGVLH